MTTDGLKLSELADIAVALAGTDQFYVIRGSNRYRTPLSRLRVTASQISNASAIGRSLLTAADLAAVLTALGLGALADLDTVGTAQIDAEAVTLALMADLGERRLIIGDATNRPATLLTSTTIRDLLGAANPTDAKAILEIVGAISEADIDGQTEETVPDNFDYILIFDTSTGELRKMSRGNFLSGVTATIDADAIGGLTAETVADDADYIVILDDSTGELRKMLRSDFLAGITGGGGGVDVSLAGSAIVSGATDIDFLSKYHTVVDVSGVPTVSLHAGILAWVLFDGSSGSVVANYNVTSVTRTGAGRYTITFASALASADYVVHGCGQFNNLGGSGDIHIARTNADSDQTTGSVKVLSVGNDGGFYDARRVHIIVVG